MESSADTRTLKIVANNSTLEEEVYKVTTDGISLITFGINETFDPPLQLLKFPMRVGDGFDWSGTFTSGKPLPTNAEITTAAESISLATGAAQAVRVDVLLKLSDGSPQPSERRMVFWFVKGEGPVRRDFGDDVREPRVEVAGNSGGSN
ncbi:MAG: hypothetical protein AKCLJLPJ_01929 [Fimbriimonadales bacterium]|nr:MAG: hypothetical protein EDM73_09700 [Armatimonadota bacterium]MBV6503835.1 hypothetical protein [Fimbriimonadales bacterium]MCE7899625.1 hypothetical protein [Armatimonadetes bacterium ATM1]MDL1927710.1 hypothetical protein [Fimbriimonadia bacterium ATM]MBC6970680.1 hypothetical protein [Armatimonadota bacterium]